MTGSLQLEDLPKLDKMVNDFDAIKEDGPNKILRGKLNGKAKHFLEHLNTSNCYWKYFRCEKLVASIPVISRRQEKYDLGADGDNHRIPDNVEVIFRKIEKNTSL